STPPLFPYTTLFRSLQAERDRDPVTRRAFDIAQKLEGLTRHASTHAAGIVIGDRPLTELVPLYRDPKSLMPVTQYNMKWVEPARSEEHTSELQSPYD